MVSIVIPAYNTSPTIGQTLESCLRQTYIDIEILVIDDCSTDNTKDIVKSYADKDSRIRLLCNDSNIGAGMTRDKGIKEMRGEYMMFLDSDDWIEDSHIQTLFDAIKEYGVDIVSSGIICTDEDGNEIERRIPEFELQIGWSRYKHDKTDTKRFMPCMLIKSSLWRHIDYSHRRFGEDVSTLCRLLHYASDMLVLNYAGYHYRQRATSLCHTADAVKKLVYKALSMKEKDEFFREVKSPYLNTEGFVTYANWLLCNIPRDGYEDEFKEIEDYLKTLNK